MTSCIRHMVQCRCVLSRTSSTKHQFPVFSIIDDEGSIVPKFAQCNNCGIVHRVIEVNRSSIVRNKESIGTSLTIDDLSITLPERLVALFNKHNVDDITLWEHAKYIIDNKRWGDFVVIANERMDDTLNVKLVKFISDNIFIVESETRTDCI